MKRKEKVQNQILYWLEESGPLTSQQLASYSNPPTSVGEITEAANALVLEDEVVKIDGKWHLVEESSDADAA